MRNHQSWYVNLGPAGDLERYPDETLCAFPSRFSRLSLCREIRDKKLAEDWDESFKIELSKPGDGFCLSLDFHFGIGDYNAVAPSIICYEEDSHFDKYYYLFGKLRPYIRQESNGVDE